MIKFKLFVLFASLSMFNFSCKKDEQLECEKRNVGYLTITNTSNTPYEVYIDDVFKFEVDANNFYEEYELSPGNYELSALEVTNGTPRGLEKSISIDECGHECWVLD